MYYIYHILGIKIGCSKKPAKRVAHQGYTDYTILEEHSCIYEVSKREMELQKQWGYPVDSKPYWQVVQMGLAGASAGGKAAVLVGAQSKAGKIAGRIAVESGQLARISRAGTKAAILVGLHSIGGKAGSKITNAIRVQCPYCDKISTPGAIGSHKKACKQKPLC